MCNSLRSTAPIRGRQSNRDADMLEILQSGGNKLCQFSYLLGGIPLPRKCQLFELVKCGKLMSEIWNIQFLENLLFSVRPCHAPSSPRKSANKKGAPQRRDAPCKSASLIAATQSSYHHYGYNELREKHLLPSNSPIVKRIRRFNCVASSVYHTRARKGS